MPLENDSATEMTAIMERTDLIRFGLRMYSEMQGVVVESSLVVRRGPNLEWGQLSFVTTPLCFESNHWTGQWPRICSTMLVQTLG